MNRTTPSTALMHFAYLLTGVGTMLLGPILPLLARQWQLADSDSGLLLLAQFCGSFVGGVTVSAKLRRDLLVGLLAAGGGLLVFALAPGLAVACAGIAVGGAGIGRTLTVISILAGRRASGNRGVGLMRLNVTWSFGALLSPLLAAWLTPHVPLRGLLGSFAGLFLASALVFAFQLKDAEPETDAVGGHSTGVVGLRTFLYFAGLLVLYGGLETCLNGWLTTFALRYGHAGAGGSEYTMVLLLAGVTFGRAGASILLARFGDVLLQRAGLMLSIAFAIALARAGSAEAIAVFAVLLGLSLAPVFPATFSIAMGAEPSARQAGWIMAASAIGAALLPWMMGVISARSGSLQLALCVPVAAAGAMLAMSLLWRAAKPAGV